MPVFTAHRSTPQVLAGGGTSVGAGAAEVVVLAAGVEVVTATVVGTAVVDVGLLAGGAWVVAGVAVGPEEVQAVPRTRQHSRTLGVGLSLLGLRTSGA